VAHVHASARAAAAPGAVTFVKTPPVFMGGEKRNTHDAEYARREATAETVARVVAALAD
jgi:hypothetical protein